MKKLQDILYKVPIEGIFGNPKIEISSLSYDSRKIQQKGLFIAQKGTQLDGNKFISEAIDKGAIAINKNEVVECAAKKNLNIKDLTGAGDLFAGGYLHGLINNKSTKENLETGTEMSSKVIQIIGARL